jgi:hypothetical protein
MVGPFVIVGCHICRSQSGQQLLLLGALKDRPNEMKYADKLSLPKLELELELAGYQHTLRLLMLQSIS